MLHTHTAPASVCCLRNPARTRMRMRASNPHLLNPPHPTPPRNNPAPRAQEVGGNHGVALWGRADSGFASMPGMDHLIFVATRMQIRMESYPKW